MLMNINHDTLQLILKIKILMTVQWISHSRFLQYFSSVITIQSVLDQTQKNNGDAV